jgi:type II secretory pathway component PulF
VHPFYPFLILTITFVMVLGLVTFVIPTYNVVLEEMVAGPLPRPSRILFGTVNYLVHRTHSWVLLGLLPFAILVFWLRSRFAVRRPERPYLLSRIGDSLKWYLPILHWFEKNHALLQVAEMLRLSLKGGCPINEAIGATLGLDVNIHFRRRLECWRRCVEAGDNVAISARRCGLGNAFAWAFDATAGAVETPNILSMLETFYRSNYGYRVNLARFILWPCVIICLGVVVGFVVLAIFLPLISTIGFMSSLVYP